MASPSLQRRLAAVLSADVVGYSRLMERDEDGTFARLKALRQEIVVPLLVQYRGRIVKLMGDGAHCEFQSIVDAVACAVLIQQGIAERETSTSEEDRIRFRIGINLGDVIHEDDGISTATVSTSPPASRPWPTAPCGSPAPPTTTSKASLTVPSSI